MSSFGIKPSESGRSVVKWFLLDANRMVVTALLTAVTLALLLGVGALDLPLRLVLREADTIEALFLNLVGVLVTGMTLVVSINQLVLSQEFGSLGRHNERMEKSMEFRKESEREFDWTGPPRPDPFLNTLVDTTLDRAKTLQEEVSDNPDEHLRERVDQFVERLETTGDEIGAALEGAEFGEFTVTEAALAYNYSWKIYVLRRIYWEHKENVSEEEREAFDDVTDVLELFGPAEEFFKAHYLQWELVNLSRRILFTGVPALIVSILAALYLKPEIVSGLFLGIPTIVWLISLGVTFALVPFFVFTAYVLRTASIAKATGAIGPFVLQESEQAPFIDWEE